MHLIFHARSKCSLTSSEPWSCVCITENEGKRKQVLSQQGLNDSSHCKVADRRGSSSIEGAGNRCEGNWGKCWVLKTQGGYIVLFRSFFLIAKGPQFNSWVRKICWRRIGYPLQYSWASLMAQPVKNLSAMRETWVRSLGWEDPLKKGKSTHSSMLAWRIPWTV